MHRYVPQREVDPKRNRLHRWFQSAHIQLNSESITEESLMLDNHELNVPYQATGELKPELHDLATPNSETAQRFS
jgi:hypothetical protein